MGKSEQRADYRSTSRSLGKHKSGKSVLVVDEDEEPSSHDSAPDKSSRRAKKKAEKKAKRKHALASSNLGVDSNKTPDEILDELLACSSHDGRAKDHAALGDRLDSDDGSHLPTSVVGSEGGDTNLPYPSSCPRAFGASSAIPQSQAPATSSGTCDASAPITKGDLLDLQHMLLGSFSTQFGQTIQAINTRMDVMDQDKLAMEGRMDQMQAQLLQLHDSLAQESKQVLRSSRSPAPPGIQSASCLGPQQPQHQHYQPQQLHQARSGAEPDRSTSPCARNHAPASDPHVPHFGDPPSIFASQRGRSPPRATHLDKTDLHGQPMLQGTHRTGDSSVSGNIVRIASVPPYLRHYEGADDGSLLRRMLNIGPFSQNLLLDEMRAHLVDHKLVPLDSEVHSRAKYSRHALVVCHTEDDARLVREQFRIAKPRHCNKVLYANQVLTKAQAKRGWQLREARRGLLPGLPGHQQRQVELCYKSGLVYINREVAAYFRGDQVYLGPGFPASLSRADFEARFSQRG
eukprot:6492473-Amphidinium_carterae.2